MPEHTEWRSGQSGNPKGRPVRGLQSFKDRLVYWLEHKTIGEIEESVADEKKWKKLLSIDALVVRRIAQACEKKGTKEK